MLSTYLKLVQSQSCHAPDSSGFCKKGPSGGKLRTSVTSCLHFNSMTRRSLSCSTQQLHETTRSSFSSPPLLLFLSKLLQLIGVGIQLSTVVGELPHKLCSNRCLGTTNPLPSHELLISYLGRNYNEVISIIKPQGVISGRG